LMYVLYRLVASYGKDWSSLFGCSGTARLRIWGLLVCALLTTYMPCNVNMFFRRTLFLEYVPICFQNVFGVFWTLLFSTFFHPMRAKSQSSVSVFQNIISYRSLHSLCNFPVHNNFPVNYTTKVDIENQTNVNWNVQTRSDEFRHTITLLHMRTS
jgi:hypothetical protein